jgi:hypothetical protein
MHFAYWGWLFLRALKWVLWLACIAFCIEFVIHRQDHLNSFGHLLPTTEFWMFTLLIAPGSIGFLELMMRERAGRPRPAFGRDWGVLPERSPP